MGVLEWNHHFMVYGVSGLEDRVRKLKIKLGNDRVH